MGGAFEFTSEPDEELVRLRDIERAQERHPDCVIVPVSHPAPLLPHWPQGFHALLAVPREKVREADPNELHLVNGALNYFRQFGVDFIRIGPPLPEATKK